MTATGHALIGTFIAAKFTDPFIGLPLSFLSHFAADFVPHWDSGTHGDKKSKKRMFFESIADLALSVLVALVFYTMLLGGKDIRYLFVCVFLSQLPDYLYIPYMYLNIKSGIFAWNIKIQNSIHKSLDKPWGIITQVVVIIIIYVFFFRFV